MSRDVGVDWTGNAAPLSRESLSCAAARVGSSAVVARGGGAGVSGTTGENADDRGVDANSPGGFPGSTPLSPAASAPRSASWSSRSAGADDSASGSAFDAGTAPAGCAGSLPFPIPCCDRYTHVPLDLLDAGDAAAVAPCATGSPLSASLESDNCSTVYLRKSLNRCGVRVGWAAPSTSLAASWLRNAWTTLRAVARPLMTAACWCRSHTLELHTRAPAMLNDRR